MNPGTLYYAMCALWPTFGEKVPREAFESAWGPSVSRIPDAEGGAAIRRLGESSKWAPTLSEFLGALRIVQRDTAKPTPKDPHQCTCGFEAPRTPEGDVTMNAHQGGCAPAQALLARIRKDVSGLRQRFELLPKSVLPSAPPVELGCIGREKGCPFRSFERKDVLVHEAACPVAHESRRELESFFGTTAKKA
jgi:hypothetical protein